MEKEYIDGSGVIYSQNREVLVKFPETYIGEYTVLDGVVTIEDRAFISCGSLTKITLPDGLKKIGDQAFYNCASLCEINLPKSVTLIGSEAFVRCNKIKNIVVDSPNFIIEDGILYNKDKTVLMFGFSNLINHHAMVPRAVTTISKSAFSNNNTIKSITIHSYQDKYYDDEVPYSVKTNILYIHGLKRDSSGKESRSAATLRASLDPKRYSVYAPTFPTDAKAALELAKEIIVENHINIIVGSSLGGFISLCLRKIPLYYPAWTEYDPSFRDIPKIVINPCLRPDIELPKLGNIDFVDSYSQLLPSLWDSITPSEKELTIGIFSNNDKLFSYKDEFLKHYTQSIDIKDGHRISEENIREIIAPLVKEIKYNSNQ